MMNYPDDEAELQVMLERVSGMVERDEASVARFGHAHKVYLNSSRKILGDVQAKLCLLKAERESKI